MSTILRIKSFLFLKEQMNLFRYPGGKTKLLSTLAPVLNDLVKNTSEFHDVFAGGLAVTLFVAEHHSSLSLHVNDMDPRMAAFYRVLTKPKELRILNLLIRATVPSIAWFKSLRQETPEEDVELAYQAMFFNRCCFSGILDANPIGGWDQQSDYKVGCRFHPERVAAEVNRVAHLVGRRLVAHQQDGVEYIRSKPSAHAYLDPPYWVQGDKLYAVKMDEGHHAALAEALRHHRHWALSYDDAEHIRLLYSFARVIPVELFYSTARRTRIDNLPVAQAKRQELIIVPR